MATGMVLIIVTRHIDLSVGSMLGFTAMLMGVIQVWVLPSIFGIGHPDDLDHHRHLRPAARHA